MCGCKINEENLKRKGEKIMKKMKKVFALLVAMVMVMGMTMTTMAAERKLTSNITVKGLTEGANTKLDAYQAVSYDVEQNIWVVAAWADDYIKLNDEKTAYEITDAVELGKAAESQEPTYTGTTTTQEYTFKSAEIGAYVILASDDKETVYTTMVAETYKDNAEYIEAEDKTIFAKADKVKLDKKAKEGDKFIGRGEEVEFTITTTFPNYETPDSEDNTFTIVDAPTGLDITEVTSLTIGGEAFEDYTVAETDNGVFTIDLTNAIGTTNANAGKTVVVTYKAIVTSDEEAFEDYTVAETDNGVFTIDLTNAIGTTNANAGKTVVVTYKAIVTSDEGYSNTANAFKNDATYGDDTEEGFTGDITLVKYALDDNNDDLADNAKLAGAKFKVHKDNKNGEVLFFVKVGDGLYKHALADEDGAIDELEVSAEGELKVTGLGNGTYFFEETKAPDGYSINEDGATVTIEGSESENVSMNTHVIDTKLSSLPSTGGIGTTIFTIGGCVIMIVAAGLFFASRRKESK